MASADEVSAEKRKSDGKSYGITLKGISQVILASADAREEGDKAREGGGETEFERGKCPSGIRSGFSGFTTGRGIIHALINSVRGSCLSRK